MRVASPPNVLAYVRDAYKRYYDSAFWMRDPGIMRERDEILALPGVMAQEALLEAVPVYPSVKDIGDACRDAGLSEFTARYLGPVVFGNDAIKLRDHQAKSLVTAHKGTADGHRNVIVTSGTGSGKTESFLLPLLAGLLEERRSSVGNGSLHRWWEKGLEGNQSTWKSTRDDILDGPIAAVRALVLYPTNALVEDQVSRLRQAAIRARDIHEMPLFYFGRYTGATPGGTFFPQGPLNAKGRNKVNEVAAEIKKIAREAKSLHKALSDRGKSGNELVEAISQFQDPECGELLTRWDMIATPPDILITNTSMLNIMLMRDVEDPIFDKTRAWLQADPSNVFSLVVDELHGYRGTQGTEVALVVRNLLDRLGLQPGSPQLRCIGTSASLDGDTGQAYLEEFFGVPRETFTILKGRPSTYEAALPLAGALLAKLEAAVQQRDVNPEDLQVALEGISPRETLAAACNAAGKGEEGHVRPTRLHRLKEVLLGSTASDAAFEGFLAAAKNESGDEAKKWESPLPTFRSHMFLRQVQGIWACSNPACDQGPRGIPQSRAKDRKAVPCTGDEMRVRRASTRAPLLLRLRRGLPRRVQGQGTRKLSDSPRGCVPRIHEAGNGHGSAGHGLRAPARGIPVVLARRVTSAGEPELDAPRPGEERAEAILICARPPRPSCRFPPPRRARRRRCYRGTFFPGAGRQRRWASGMLRPVR